MNRQFLAINGLAIVLVVLNHSILMLNDIPKELGYLPLDGWQSTVMLALRSLGIIAVPIFLFISGSFFAYAARTKNNSLKFFYRISWANIRHILWPYLIWSLIFYAAVFIGRGEKYSLFGYIKNLIVGYPFNFVPLLLFYYALAPIIVRLGRRYGWVLLAAITIYQAILLNLYFPGLLGGAFPQWVGYLAPPVLSWTLAYWAIYFPLGVLYGMHMEIIYPIFLRLKWMLLAIMIIGLGLAVLNTLSVIDAQWAEFLAPLLFVLIIPLIKRQSIPMVRGLEKIGQKVYGVYLTNLIVLYFAVLLMDFLFPAILLYRFWLIPIMFILALGLPMALMLYLGKSRSNKIYLYVFG